MKTNRRKHKNTNDKKKKINRKNTTKRSKKTMNTIQYYHKFRNTHFLPYTKIMKFMEKQFPEYEISYKKKQNEKTIYDLFQIDFSNSLQESKGVYNGVNILNNPSFSLNDLISYSIFSLSKEFFRKNDNEYTFQTNLLKYQTGKDIRRIKLILNENVMDFRKENEGGESEEEPNYYEITDKYIQLLLENYGSENINYNLINKICMLSCQNLFNLMSDFFQLLLIQITKDYLQGSTIQIAPGAKEDIHGNPTLSHPKYIDVKIDKDNKTVTYHFDTFLFNFPDFERIGRLSYVLSFHLITNRFQLESLHINYDLTKPKTDSTSSSSSPSRYSNMITNIFSSNPSRFTSSETNSESSSSHPPTPYKKYAKYAIPAGIVGIGTAALFASGVLGGKSKKKKRSQGFHKKTVRK